MSRLRRAFSYAAAWLCIVTLLSGCGGAASISSLLRVAKVAAEVRQFQQQNKTVISIVADIVSGKSLREVIAKIFRSGDSHPQEIVLTANSEGKFEGSYEATPSETQQTSYTAVVEATDTAGTTAESQPVNVVVPATP